LSFQKGHARQYEQHCFFHAVHRGNFQFAVILITKKKKEFKEEFKECGSLEMQVLSCKKQNLKAKKWMNELLIIITNKKNSTVVLWKTVLTLSRLSHLN